MKNDIEMHKYFVPITYTRKKFDSFDDFQD